MEKVQAFATRHSQNGATVNQHALNFLRDWLLHHIENDDARLGVWLIEHKPG
jgi:hemerythrin